MVQFETNEGQNPNLLIRKGNSKGYAHAFLMKSLKLSNEILIKFYSSDFQKIMFTLHKDIQFQQY